MMSKKRVHRKYRVNIIIGSLTHVSFALLRVLSAHCILRGMVQSVAWYFVHGHSVSVPRNLGVKPGALSHHLLLSLGVALSCSQCHANPMRPKPGCDPHLNCLKTYCLSHQVICSCVLHKGPFSCKYS